MLIALSNGIYLKWLINLLLGEERRELFVFAILSNISGFLRYFIFFEEMV